VQNSNENYEGLEPDVKYLCLGPIDLVVFEIQAFLHVQVSLYYWDRQISTSRKVL